MAGTVRMYDDQLPTPRPALVNARRLAMLLAMGLVVAVLAYHWRVVALLLALVVGYVWYLLTGMAP